MSKDNKKRMHPHVLACGVKLLQLVCPWRAVHAVGVNMVQALLRPHVSTMSWTDGRGDPMIFYPCPRQFMSSYRRPKELPNQVKMQLVRTLPKVPLQKTVRLLHPQKQPPQPCYDWLLPHEVDHQLCGLLIFYGQKQIHHGSDVSALDSGHLPVEMVSPNKSSGHACSR